MTFEERLFLYALVRGTAPKRVLEIGTSQGGSAAIFAAALEANGSGLVVGIDPAPRIDLPGDVFHDRFHLITGESPGAIEKASEIAGGLFDLVLIDGMHIYQQAADDLAGALPFMADHAYILFHDSFHYGVSEAIREAIESDPTLHDCGYVCAQPRTVGLLLTHGGFRLVRRGAAAIDVEAMVKPAWDHFDLPVPHDPDLRNHDIYYCEYVQPCAHCRKEREASPEAITDAAAAELTRLLTLRSCRFERPPYAESFDRLEPSGVANSTKGPVTDSRMGRQGPELPADGAELLVLHRDAELGRFVLAPTPGEGASLEQRFVAVALADQVGATLAGEPPAATGTVGTEPDQP